VVGSLVGRTGQRSRRAVDDNLQLDVATLAMTVTDLDQQLGESGTLATACQGYSNRMTALALHANETAVSTEEELRWSFEETSDYFTSNRLPSGVYVDPCDTKFIGLPSINQSINQFRRDLRCVRPGDRPTEQSAHNMSLSARGLAEYEFEISRQTSIGDFVADCKDCVFVIRKLTANLAALHAVCSPYQ